MIGIGDEASSFFLWCLALWLGYLNGVTSGRAISYLCAPDVVATASTAMFYNVLYISLILGINDCRMVVAGYLVSRFPIWMEWTKWLTYAYPTLRVCQLQNTTNYQATFYIAFGEDDIWTSDGLNEYSVNGNVTGSEILPTLNIHSPFILWSYLLLEVGWLIFTLVVAAIVLCYWQPKRKRA